jgi:hypothetical protein
VSVNVLYPRDDAIGREVQENGNARRNNEGTATDYELLLQILL